MTPEQREKFRWNTAAQIMAGLAANPDRNRQTHKDDAEFSVFAADALITQLEATAPDDESDYDITSIFDDALDIIRAEAKGPNEAMREAQTQYTSLYCKDKPAPDADGWIKDGWIKWAGGECPVKGDTFVEVYLGSEPEVGEAEDFAWFHDDHTPSNILGYRIVTP